jgi:hypothetical protein
MSKRIGLVALAALCAVALSAVAASGASAAGTTAFTCVSQAGGAFKNAHCNNSAAAEEGAWAHKAIAEGETTQLTTTAVGTTELKVKIAGANTVLKATGVECVGCHFKNQIDPTSGVMSAMGEGGHLKYTGVTINVASCKVKGGTVTTKPLTLTTFAEGGALKATVAPVTPKVEAIIETENNGTSTCTLPAEIIVEGHATGTAHGATASFETGAGELNVGAQTATLKGEITVSGGPTEAAHGPVALTETAS